MTRTARGGLSSDVRRQRPGVLSWMICPRMGSGKRCWTARTAVTRSSTRSIRNRIQGRARVRHRGRALSPSATRGFTLDPELRLVPEWRPCPGRKVLVTSTFRKLVKSDPLLLEPIHLALNPGVSSDSPAQLQAFGLPRRNIRRGVRSCGSRWPRDDS